MLHRLDTNTEEMPLTIEDLFAEYGQFKHEECKDIHAVQKKGVKAITAEDRVTGALVRFYHPRLFRRRERSNLPRCHNQKSFSTLSARHIRGYHADITSNMEAARISSLGTVCSASKDGKWKSDEDLWKILPRLLS
ncbi:hypothetical protein OESDEN_20161 [Oesophagostomum dentatum]|uniref:Uncharacterized protein n=1 Tax=Oesophagostomum dentatum TaxID=61180 RepID=A0A0B1S9J5_OESDE|nr:hypothetical protein OESDEN_20161 [Oesophagostomum dentatum]